MQLNYSNEKNKKKYPLLLLCMDWTFLGSVVPCMQGVHTYNELRRVEEESCCSVNKTRFSQIRKTFVVYMSMLLYLREKVSTLVVAITNIL